MPDRAIEPLVDSVVLVGDYSDGPITYTITAATADGVPVEPDLTDLFDLVLDRLGGSPCDEWVNPVTGHGGDCGCISCHMSQNQ